MGAVEVACSLVLSLLVTREAAAEVRWAAPENCPDAATIREDVERLSGVHLEDVDEMKFDATITELVDARFRVVLRTSRREEETDSAARVIDGATCAEVANAAIVAISMAIQSALNVSAEETRSRPPPSLARKDEAITSALPAVKLNSTSKRRQSEKRNTSPGLAASMNMMLDTGALPHVATGVELGVSAIFGSFRPVLFAGVFAQNHAERPDGHGGDFRLATAGALACVERHTDSLDPSICAGFEVGELSADGTGVSITRHGRTFWRAPRAEAAVGWRFTAGVSVLGRLGIVMPLNRSEFVLGSSEVVHRPNSLTGRALIGIQVEL